MKERKKERIAKERKRETGRKKEESKEKKWVDGE